MCIFPKYPSLNCIGYFKGSCIEGKREQKIIFPLCTSKGDEQYSSKLKALKFGNIVYINMSSCSPKFQAYWFRRREIEVF